MYKTCPKCNYKRSERDHEAEGICPGCGLIYAKWLKNRFREEVQDPTANQTATPATHRCGTGLAKLRRSRATLKAQSIR